MKKSEIAKILLETEKETYTKTKPASTGVIVKWNGDCYIGSIQVIVPELSNEIVLLSKTSFSIDEELINEVRKIDTNRLELEADTYLSLTGRQHILRRVESNLIPLTPEQTEYVQKHPFAVFETEPEKGEKKK